MKYFKIFISVLLLTLLGWTAWYFKADKKIDRDHQKLELIRDVLSKPLPRPAQETPPSLPEVASTKPTLLACEPFVEQVSYRPLIDILGYLQTGSRIPEGCFYTEWTAWPQDLKNNLRNSCLVVDWKDRTQHDRCFQALLELKAHLILQNVQTEDLTALTYDQLAALLFSRITKVNRSGVSPDLLNIANELEQRDPGNPSVKKALTFALMAEYSAIEEAADAEDKELLQEKLEQFNEVAEQASSLNPDDWQIYEMRLFVLTRANESNAQNLAEEISIQYPENGLGPYYLGWMAWERKDRAAALQHAREASQRQPDIQRFKDTVDKIEKASFKQEAFQIRVRFNPADL